MTRLLTSEEIESIIDFIKPQEGIPEETALCVVKMTKNRLRKQLCTQRVFPSIIKNLKDEIIKQYNNSFVQAGESVGVICAQSIGEVQTQMTLNTFHKAGQSEKTFTAGVPRFKELIDASKKPRLVNHKIYLAGKNSTIQETRLTVGNNIVGLTLLDISESITININKKNETWYESYKILFNREFENHEHCVSVKINMKKLYQFKLSMKEIAESIQADYSDLHCVFSPDEKGQLDIFVDTTNIVLPEDRLLFVGKQNAKEIYLEEVVKPIIEEKYICGIPSITEIFFLQEEKEWILETNSFNSKDISNQYSSFKRLMALEIVDYTRTISSDVWDIYEVLGIEAARQFLIEEFINILGAVNKCHVMLLVDRMTHIGTISSISRYTLKGDEAGPMGKASFEETMDNFLNAGAQGQHEPTRGVSASIICGKRANMGTGMINIGIDIPNLPQIKRDIYDKIGTPILKNVKEDRRLNYLENKESGFVEI